MYFAYLLIGCLVLAVSSSHEWHFGSCPSVAPFQNLAIDKFLGLWYVMEQFDTTSTCLTFNYTKESETQLKVTKNRQFYILDRAGLDHSNSYTGTLDIPFSSNKALLRVKWPLNAAGKGDYIIFDTDYSNYAGVYDCQQIAFFVYRESAAILSRSPTLEKMFVDKVKQRLEKFKVDTSEFNKIDHSNCRPTSETDFDLNVDQDTFKNIFHDTVDTVKDVADKVATGVQDAADSVVDTFRNMGSGNPAEIQEGKPEKMREYLADVEIIQ